jgi:hypothetical protein
MVKNIFWKLNYPFCKKWYGCKWTYPTLHLDTNWSKRLDMDVDEHERLSNIILGHKLK